MARGRWHIHEGQSSLEGDDVILDLNHLQWFGLQGFPHDTTGAVLPSPLQCILEEKSICYRSHLGLSRCLRTQSTAVEKAGQQSCDRCSLPLTGQEAQQDRK